MLKRDCCSPKMSVRIAIVSVKVKSEGRLGKMNFTNLLFSFVPNFRMSNRFFQLSSLSGNLCWKVLCHHENHALNVWPFSAS